ncbi:MAG: 4-hydroxythreonine-4-phosphate dehydrogenase PdxA [Ferroplasma sp.]
MLNIGITLGDPAGIGPEIVAKALYSMNRRDFKVTIFGDEDNFQQVLKSCGLNYETVKNYNFINTGNGQTVEMGKLTSYSGSIAYKNIELAVQFAAEKKIDALATAPINKQAMIQSGSKYIDHTSMLKALTGSTFITTLFEIKKLRITFLSKHMSLMDAVKYVKRENIYNAILDTSKSMNLLGFMEPRIAVAALNPHAGESGIFGSEEKDEIIPAINDAMDKVNVSGPIPADSVFHFASLGNYDVVLALYHDQGHIAAKTYDFRHTVSMNPGLPFLRTSVDHGTAFDIAGKNRADFASMKDAILTARKYATVYKKRYSFLKRSS